MQPGPCVHVANNLRMQNTIQTDANMQTRFITRFKKDDKQKMFCPFQLVVKNLEKRRETLNPQTTQVLIQQIQLVFGS